MMTHDRREFLGLIAGGAAITAAPMTNRVRAHPPAARLARLAAASAQDDEAFWQLVQHEFPVRSGLAMMNAANLCPSPYAVIDTVARLTRDVDADASFQNRGKFGALRQEARQRLAAHLGADATEIAITRNTSEGNNTVVHGLGSEPPHQQRLLGGASRAHGVHREEGGHPGSADVGRRACGGVCGSHHAAD
jgi:hypothetical protein